MSGMADGSWLAAHFSLLEKLGPAARIPLIQIKQIETRLVTLGLDVRGIGRGIPATDRERPLSEQLHPMAPHHLPFFLAPGSGTDVLMVIMGLFLVGTMLWLGTLYWKLHSLPERMAHKSQKLQFEFVAVLGLISLFTHMHIFWVAGLLLALIDIPDFGTPLRSIADSVEKIADATPEGEPPHASLPPEERPDMARQKEPSHV
jgi:hypothetical protein